MKEVLTLANILKPHLIPGRADAIRRRWQDGQEEADVLALLQKQPEMVADKSVVYDLIHEEYCLRLERGEELNMDEFCARFPYPPEEVKQLLASCQYLEESGLLERAEIIDWPRPGERIGDLHLLRELGRGQFAVVYLAREESTGGRLVAVKFTRDGEHEALTLGPLNHKNIVKVLSAGPFAGTNLCVVRMPYHGPATLKNLIERAGPQQRASVPQQARVILDTGHSEEAVDDNDEPASVLLSGNYEEGVVWLIGKIAGALAFLHQRGICHRDLKPTNVLLSPSGQPLLLDFNVAIGAAGISTVNATRLGGTIPYMSANILRKMLDRGFKLEHIPEADVFALGVIGHELLTGQHPFGPIPASMLERDLMELMLRRQEERAATNSVPLLGTTRLAPDTPFFRLLARALAADPVQRPTAAQLQAAAEAHLAPAAPRAPVSRRFARLTAAVLFLALFAGGFAWLRNANHAAPAPVVLTDKEKADALHEKGRRYLAEGDRVSALHSFQQAYALDRQGRAQASIAFLLALKRSHPEAINACDLAINKGFKNAQIYNNRGHSIIQLWRNGNTEDGPEKDREISRKARDDFYQAIALDPKLAAPYINLSLLVIRDSQWNRTESNWKPSQDDIEKVRQGMRLEIVGPRQAHYAAQVLALAASRQPELKEESLAYLTQALEKGANPRNLKSETSIFLPLRDMPAFQQLSKTPQKTVIIREEQLLDPDLPASR